jgi:hypothetical protein
MCVQYTGRRQHEWTNGSTAARFVGAVGWRSSAPALAMVCEQLGFTVILFRLLICLLSAHTAKCIYNNFISFTFHQFIYITITHILVNVH